MILQKSPNLFNIFKGHSLRRMVAVLREIRKTPLWLFCEGSSWFNISIILLFNLGSPSLQAHLLVMAPWTLDCLVILAIVFPGTGTPLGDGCNF